MSKILKTSLIVFVILLFIYSFSYATGINMDIQDNQSSNSYVNNTNAFSNTNSINANTVTNDYTNRLTSTTNDYTTVTSLKTASQNDGLSFSNIFLTPLGERSFVK